MRGRRRRVSGGILSVAYFHLVACGDSVASLTGLGRNDLPIRTVSGDGVSGGQGVVKVHLRPMFLYFIWSVFDPRRTKYCFLSCELPLRPFLCW